MCLWLWLVSVALGDCHQSLGRSLGRSGMYKPIIMVPTMGWMTINNAPCFDQIHMVTYWCKFNPWLINPGWLIVVLPPVPIVCLATEMVPQINSRLGLWIRGWNYTAPYYGFLWSQVCVITRMCVCIKTYYYHNMSGVFPPINPSYVDVHQGFLRFWPSSPYGLIFGVSDVDFLTGAAPGNSAECLLAPEDCCDTMWGRWLNHWNSLENGDWIKNNNDVYGTYSWFMMV